MNDTGDNEKSHHMQKQIEENYYKDLNLQIERSYYVLGKFI